MKHQLIQRFPPCRYDKRRFQRVSALALLLTIIPFHGYGQDHRIESFSISAGGGTSSGGGYALSGTIGPADASQTPLTGGAYELQGGFWNVALQLDLPEPDDSFTEWLDSFPPDQQPPPDMRGPADAPAGDGMSNLLKYALGLDPMTPSRDGAPSVAITETSDPVLAIGLIRSVDAEVDLQLEHSTDLKTWNDIPFTIQQLGPVEDDRERIRVLSAISPTDSGNHFLRLRIQK